MASSPQGERQVSTCEKSIRRAPSSGCRAQRPSGPVGPVTAVWPTCEKPVKPGGARRKGNFAQRDGLGARPRIRARRPPSVARPRGGLGASTRAGLLGRPGDLATAAGVSPPRHRAAADRSGSRSRSGCGCSPTRASASGASSGACARTRRRSGRRGSSRSPRPAGRSRRAPAPCRRGRRAPGAARTRAGSARGSRLPRRPGSGRHGSRARRPTSGPVSSRVWPRRWRRTTASIRAITSSGWQGFATQSSAPRRSPRTRWATVAPWVQTITPRSGSIPQTRSMKSQPSGPSSDRIDDQGVQLHRRQLLGRHRARERPVLAAGALEPLDEDVNEPGVVVDDRYAKCRGLGAHRLAARPGPAAGPASLV